MIEQAQQAEADGFSALWYPSAVAGDPVAAMAVGRAGRRRRSSSGTSVLQTYTAHPVLQANRAASAALARWAGPGFTLGIGPSHEPVIEGMYGLSVRHPGPAHRGVRRDRRRAAARRVGRPRRARS